jgi:glycosyltransferase involved in cell wall biosynthesis
MILGTAISTQVLAAASRRVASVQNPDIVVCIPQVETWKFRGSGLDVIAVGEGELPCDSAKLREVVSTFQPDEVVVPLGIPRCSPVRAARLIASMRKQPFVLSFGRFQLRWRPLIVAVLVASHLVAWFPLKIFDGFCSHLDGAGVIVGGLIARCWPPRHRGDGDGEKVIHVIPSLGTGGTQRQVVEYFKNAGAGPPLALVALFDQGDRFVRDLEAAGLNVEILTRRCRRTLFGRAMVRFFPDTSALVALVRHLRSVRPTSVISWLFRANVVTVPAARIAGIPRIVSSVRNLSHWKSWPEYRRWWYRAADRTAASLSDRILANSRAAAADYVRWLARQSIHVTVIPNGLDIDAFLAAPRAAPPHYMSLPVGTKILLTVGRLSIEKDHATLFRALASLSPECPEWHLVVVGHGLLEPQLRELVRRLGLTMRVTFAGRVDDPQSYFAAADLFILPSRIEGSPNALIEAQAFGVVVVTTDWPGVDEVVERGVSASVVPVGDACGLAAEIERLLIDNERRLAMGRAGAVAAREKFDIHSMVNAIDRISGRAMTRQGTVDTSPAEIPR